MRIDTGNKIEEKELIQRLKRKDPSAQRTLYEAYARYLVAVCARYIPDDDRVKDVLHDSFLQIFRKIGEFQYRGEGSLLAWMRRIVVNNSLKCLRKKSFFPLFESFDMVDSDEDPDPGVSGVPVPDLLQMIRRLPDGYRKVFNLYVFEEMSHKEIAALLGIKENSSCSQYSRARAMLAKEIADYKKEKQL